MDQDETPPPEKDRDILAGHTRKITKDQMQGQVRVMSIRKLKEMVAELIKRYENMDPAEVRAQREKLADDHDQAQALQERLEGLLEQGKERIQALQARNRGLEIEIQQLQANRERTIESARMEKLGPHLSRAERLRGDVGRAQEEGDALRARLEELQAQIEEAEARVAADDLIRRLQELEILVKRLEAHVRSLIETLDFYVVEEVFQATPYEAAFAELGEHVQAVGEQIGGDQQRMAQATQIRDRLMAIHGRTQTGFDELESLVKKMNEGEADTAVVMEIIRGTRGLLAAQEQMKVLAGGLSAVLG